MTFYSARIAVNLLDALRRIRWFLYTLQFADKLVHHHFSITTLIEKLGILLASRIGAAGMLAGQRIGLWNIID